jgi:hypothetical protein
MISCEPQTHSGRKWRRFTVETRNSAFQFMGRFVKTVRPLYKKGPKIFILLDPEANKIPITFIKRHLCTILRILDHSYRQIC